MTNRYFTKEGLEKLKQELEELKSRRHEIAERLREAAKFGDLSENFAYEETRQEQDRLETKIAELESAIHSAVISDEMKTQDIAAIGSIVKAETDGGIVEYELVGAAEALPGEGRISIESPLGRALLGHKSGDRLEIDTPAGKRTYTIVSIRLKPKP